MPFWLPTAHTRWFLCIRKPVLTGQGGSIRNIHFSIYAVEARPAAGDKAFMLHHGLDLLFLLGEHTGQLGVVLIGQFAGA
jgi:hypothetical protein